MKPPPWAWAIWARVQSSPRSASVSTTQWKRPAALRPPLASGPRRGLIGFVADRPGHDRRYAIDSSRAEAELGWRQETDFQTGLRTTVDWYLNRPDWWGPLRDRYSGERLGLKGAG